MLPKNRLGERMKSKLKVYAGSEHPHAAQNPEVWRASRLIRGRATIHGSSSVLRNRPPQESVARVRSVPGEGRIIINKRDIDDYFGLETLKLIVKQPLQLTDTLGKYDVLVTADGGGFTGQAGAIRHGIARALLKWIRNTASPEESRVPDPRSAHEGTEEIRLKAARRAPQFSKR